MNILPQLLDLKDLVNRLKSIYIALSMEDLFNNVDFPKSINFNNSFVANVEDLIQFNVET